MRLVTFIDGNGTHLGAVIDDYVVDLNKSYFTFSKSQKGDSDRDYPLFNDMRSFLEKGESAWQAAQKTIHFIRRILKERGPKDLCGKNILYKQDEIRLKAPISDPQKIVAIGFNYMGHCKEQGIDPPQQPIIFAKYPSAIIGPDEPITWPPELTQQVDYEAELAFIVGKEARNVPVDKAFDYIAGYTIVNDVTARDLQFKDKQWVRSKSLDTFCPMGPYLVSKDEIEDPHNLKIKCIVNGQVLQESNTKYLIFDIPHLLSFISQLFTLVPGDVICTGTPHGVGLFRNPRIFLKPGDMVRIEIDGLGVLSNPVVKWILNEASSE